MGLNYTFPLNKGKSRTIRGWAGLKENKAKIPKIYCNKKSLRKGGFSVVPPGLEPGTT